MHLKKFLCILCCCLLLLGCTAEELPASAETPEPAAVQPAESEPPEEEAPVQEPEPPEEQPPVEEVPVEYADEDLAPVLECVPTLFVELKYATEDNFTGAVIYDFTEAALRYGTLKKLAEVQEELLAQGYSLKIWDAFRPVSAQFALWEICPDPVYVANPNTGFSGHSRGNTVDVTLVGSDGTELEMPSGFDDFSALADRDYSDVSQEAAENAGILEKTMEDHGFRGYAGEWWHYTDTTDYPVVEQ